MSEFLDAKIDSDYDDEDYVPEEKHKADVAAKDEQSSEEETGVAALKTKKRQREVDDLFDLMNEEDDLLKAARARKI